MGYGRMVIEGSGVRGRCGVGMGKRGVGREDVKIGISDKIREEREVVNIIDISKLMIEIKNEEM